MCAGLAALNDGSLTVFWVPASGWEDGDGDEESPPRIKFAVIFKSSSHFITCAAFDPQGDKVYAATKEGKLLGFEVAPIFDHLAFDSTELPQLKPSFTIHIPGGATAWHLIVSRNGRYLVVNSADAAIRLYATRECWMTPEEVEKPTWVFQDVVSKVKFASCDISGDAEFVVGGANGIDNKYELYIWNTSSGALMDKLTGATVELYSVAWHPTRSFLAVAASDGLVDVWGPRINWTAFAPDFQALPQNVEYVECEDEFDIEEGDKEAEQKKDDDEDENAEVDVLTIEPVPVFASDSEDEEDVFSFQTKVTRLLGIFMT
jgi:WD40 repeat protein